MDSEDSLLDDELQPLALAVHGDDNDDFDLNIPPTSGNEYLRRVRCCTSKNVVDFTWCTVERIRLRSVHNRVGRTTIILTIELSRCTDTLINLKYPC